MTNDFRNTTQVVPMYQYYCFTRLAPAKKLLTKLRRTFPAANYVCEFVASRGWIVYAKGITS